MTMKQPDFRTSSLGISLILFTFGAPISGAAAPTGDALVAATTASASASDESSIPRSELTVQLVEDLIDNYKGVEEISSTNEQLELKANQLEGAWRLSGGLWGNSLQIRAADENRYLVRFQTGNCSGRWHLERIGSYENGVLRLDRPVRDCRGEMFQSLHAVRAERSLRLVPLTCGDPWNDALREAGDPGRPTQLSTGYLRITSRVDNTDVVQPYGAPGLRPWEDRAAPGQDVPVQHYIYEIVEQLESAGAYTGYSPRTFNGKRALSRRHFALATLQLMRDLVLFQRIGAPWPRHASESSLLNVLIFEFWKEIEELGVSPKTMAQTALLFQRLWRNPEPTSWPVTLALPRPVHRLLQTTSSSDLTAEKASDELKGAIRKMERSLN